MNLPANRRIAPLLPYAGLAAGIFLWWLATTHRGMMANSFTPAATAHALCQLFASGEIWPHLLASLQRVFEGLLVAAIIGIPLGILQGIFPRFERSTSVLFQFVRMVSPLAWMPIAVMALGIGNAPVLFLLSIAAVWPVLLNTTAGVHAVDKDNLILSRSLCATQNEIVFRVIIPSIIPHIITGLRLAMGIVWIVLVPAEMLGVPSGLGYFILDTRDRLAYSELLAVLLIIGGIGYLFDASLRLAYRYWTNP